MSHDPWAPIHVACVNNDPEALSRELENGVSPNLKEGGYGSRPRAPLCLVLEHARNPDATVSCVSLLLNAGASVDDSISDSTMGRMMPLQFAALRRHESCGGAPRSRRRGGLHISRSTALHYAAGLTSNYSGLVGYRISNALATRHEAATRALLEAGAKVNAAEEDGGLTPLHFAAASGMYKVSRLLLAAGASLDHAGRNEDLGVAPLAYAYRWAPWFKTDMMPIRRVMRTVPFLLRAGAALPVMPVRQHHSLSGSGHDCPYIARSDGQGASERTSRNAPLARAEVRTGPGRCAPHCVVLATPHIRGKSTDELPSASKTLARSWALFSRTLVTT